MVHFGRSEDSDRLHHRTLEADTRDKELCLVEEAVLENAGRVDDALAGTILPPDDKLEELQEKLAELSEAHDGPPCGHMSAKHMSNACDEQPLKPCWAKR